MNNEKILNLIARYRRNKLPKLSGQVRKHGDVYHEDVHAVFLRLRDTMIIFEGQCIFGFLEYALLILIEVEDPDSEKNKYFPRPTASINNDAMRVFRKYLKEQINGKRNQNA